MKDLFSTQSEGYAKYRPSYPNALFEYIYGQVDSFESCWDCGAGNGQATVVLANRFNVVKATDLSENQISHATLKSNIEYSVQPAEKTNFANNSFDLITVGQAFHWFNFDQFFKEAKRVLKPGGTVAIWGYGLNTVEDKIDELTFKFYDEIVGKYWAPERKFVESKFEEVVFPHPIERKEFIQSYEWNVDQFLGYLETWSSVQKFKKDLGSSPIDLIKDEMIGLWGDQKRSVNFPVFSIVLKIN